MEAPTHRSDPVIPETSHASQGSGAVNSRTAQRRRKVLFLGDTPNARLGQNGRDFVLQEFSLARAIRKSDQLYAELLPSRRVQ